MKFEQYMKLIEDTHSSHIKGELNEMEYINAYNEILGVVIDSDTLNEEEKRQLITIVRTKIGQIPKVEEMRKEIKNQELLAKEEAFLEAKKRFKSLSLFQKVKLNIKGCGPGQLRRSLGTVEEINGLYRK
jgi:hypothetical protein